MKKHTWAILMLMATLFISVSCTSAFTTSLVKSKSGELEKKFAKASSNDLADLAGSGLSSSEAQAVINALADKDLSKLNSNQVNNVLNTAASAIIPTSIITKIADIAETATPEELTQLVLDAVNTNVNPSAITSLLSNANAVNNASPTSVVLATASLLGSMVKETEKTYDQIAKTVEDIVNNSGENPDFDPVELLSGVLYPGNPPASGSKEAEQVKAVANILAAASGNPVEGSGYDKIDLSSLPINIFK